MINFYCFLRGHLTIAYYNGQPRRHRKCLVCNRTVREIEQERIHFYLPVIVSKVKFLIDDVRYAILEHLAH